MIRRVAAVLALAAACTPFSPAGSDDPADAGARDAATTQRDASTAHDAGVDAHTPPPSEAGIDASDPNGTKLVQSVPSMADDVGSFTVDLNTPPAAGDTLVLLIGLKSNDTPASATTDSGGKLTFESSSSVNDNLSVWILPNATGGESSVTVVLHAKKSYVAVLSEWANLGAVNDYGAGNGVMPFSAPAVATNSAKTCYLSAVLTNEDDAALTAGFFPASPMVTNDGMTLVSAYNVDASGAAEGATWTTAGAGTPHYDALTLTFDAQ